jgi:hypothetical protein
MEVRLDRVHEVQIHWQGALLVYVWCVHLCSESVGDSRGMQGLEAENEE